MLEVQLRVDAELLATLDGAALSETVVAGGFVAPCVDSGAAVSPLPPHAVRDPANSSNDAQYGAAAYPNHD